MIVVRLIFTDCEIIFQAYSEGEGAGEDGHGIEERNEFAIHGG